MEADSNIAAELKAAFCWAALDAASRKKLKKNKGLSLDDIIDAGVRANVANFSSFNDHEAAHKKNFAEHLSRSLATRISRLLRNAFPGILPDEAGRGHESKSRTARGYKKLDVNYSTPQLGLGLGVSIKTINARDSLSKRYTKNYTRVDAELRAEAADYHERQPYAVMIAAIFLPTTACLDGSKNEPSSFGAAVGKFRFRSGRSVAADSLMLFEHVFIGLYENGEKGFGDVGFFDVHDSPPRTGKPANVLSFGQLCQRITEVYDARNNPPFKWDDGGVEKLAGDADVDDDDDI